MLNAKEEKEEILKTLMKNIVLHQEKYTCAAVRMEQQQFSEVEMDKVVASSNILEVEESVASSNNMEVEEVENQVVENCEQEP